MVHHITCPSCHRMGLVRVEYVIEGSNSARSFYCGGCNYLWIEPESPREPSHTGDTEKDVKPNR